MTWLSLLLCKYWWNMKFAQVSLKCMFRSHGIWNGNSYYSFRSTSTHLSRKPHPADFLCHLLGQNLTAWPPLTGHIAILNKTGIWSKGRGRAWRWHRQPSVSATPSEPASTLPFSGQLFSIVICVQMKGSVLVRIPLIECRGSIPLHCYHKWRGNKDYLLEKGKATHSSILAWRIPWTVQSIGSQRVGHN